MAIFTNHTIIITGASEGIGRALALHLAPQRPNLALVARNVSRLQEVAAQCEHLGAKTLCIPTDIIIQEACGEMVHQVVKTFGTIHVLVNNAGVTMWTAFDDITDLSVFDRLMKVNYFGSLYCTKFALPYLKQTKGRIVAVSSIAGLTGVPTRTGYCASKFAVMGFFESLRIELSGSGVSVTIIAPDFVQSKIHERALGADGSPIGQNPLAKANIPTAEACAGIVAKAIEKRKRLVITSLRARAGRWLKLLTPTLIDRIAQNAVYTHKP